MRWLRVTALLLLAVSLSSSNLNQSTSVPPTPTLPTNDDSYETPSLPNSDSSILADSAENETSSTVSLVDNSTAEVDKSTASIDGSELEEGQAGTIEDSSTLNGLDSTPSEEEYDDDEKDEAASSQVVGPQAEPSQLGSDVESQPQSGESSSAQTNNTENFDGLSSDKLKIELDKAKKELNEAKEATRKANEKLDEKKKAAEQPNKDYEEKKKKWEKLEAIAVEKEIADREYNEASNNMTEISSQFMTAEGELNRTNDELEKAVKLQEEMPNWNQLLQDAQDKETTETAKEQPLRDSVTSSEADKKAKYKLWTTAIDDAKPTNKAFDNNKCDEAPHSTSTVCLGLIDEKVRLNNLADQAKNVYDTADQLFNATQKSLDDLLKELSELKTEIGRLAINIATINSDKINERINKLRGKLNDRNEDYNKMKIKKEEAEAELEKKKTAKEEADLSDGGITSEAVRQEAVEARAVMIQAKKARKKSNDEVKEHKAIFDKAEESETKLKDKVDLLDKKYAEARKKEEPQSGGGLLIGLGVGGTLVLIAIVAVIVVVFLKFKKKKKEGNNEGTKKNPTSKSQTPSMGASDTSQTAQKPLIPNSNTPAGAPNTPVPATVPAPLGAPPGTAVTPVTPAQQATPKPNVQSKDGPPQYLPDLKTTPFVRGEEPYKIPAENFQSKGPLVRRTRWHGDPKHDLDGKKLPEKLEKIWFDPNANFVVFTGAQEIMEDGGPASDSNRSEWLNNLDEWEKGHKEMLAAEEEAKAAQLKEDKEKAQEKLEQAKEKFDSCRQKNDEMLNNAAERARKKNPKLFEDQATPLAVEYTCKDDSSNGKGTEKIYKVGKRS